MWPARVDYVLARHFWLAVHAAVLFVVGLFVAVPVVRYRLTAVEWLPLRVFTLVVRLIGRHPTIARTALVIWVFNSLVIFLCMASGFHPMLPKLFGIWTGLNVAVVAVRAGPSHGPAIAEFGLAASGQWRPSATLTILCGALVLALELPCFWYSIAMGISMGADVQVGGDYAGALRARAIAYVVVIVPTLLVSAAAESIAVRGGMPANQGDRQGPRGQ